MTMRIIKKVLVEPATYWGAPVNDGDGGHTFAAPVNDNFLVRWDGHNERFVNSDNEEEFSRAVVMVGIDVDEGGYLFLGISNETNPEGLEGAHPIKRFDKIPTLASKTEFVRIAYLGASRFRGVA